MQTETPVMTPAPGGRLQRFVGDRVGFQLQFADRRRPGVGWRARLRTNLGRAAMLRREIQCAHTHGLPRAGASWHDVPMTAQADGWTLELPLAEPGYFDAKAYLVDPEGWQHWPAGPNIGISVHPNRYRSANIIYCAFVRLFDQATGSAPHREPVPASAIAPLEKQGYTVIPPSGKLRDLTRQLPHIAGTLGCRYLQLLPVNPTPTTYARFGRFGSPYAALDLTAIDPALVEFDQKTTGVDQFCELTAAAHGHGVRVLLDIVINHTGWGSRLQETHPEWFDRRPDGTFISPGAWGTTWEDLVELKQADVALWDELAGSFLVWCRRGVDGFRCDAGYKVPVAAWQYIISRVQQEFPETLFLLEGLGGAWEATEALLTEGGMQWAYSELFQNYSGVQVAGYLDHSHRQTARVGLLVHFSETHDNQRLAERGRAWSLLRNRLCALASVSGGFAFTSGVEWLATEKILVHGATSLNWGSPDNLLPELGRLNALLASHPCFLDGARLERLSPPDSPVYVLERQSAEGLDSVLVLVNTDLDQPHQLTWTWPAKRHPASRNPEAGKAPAAKAAAGLGWLDLLGQTAPEIQLGPDGKATVKLAAGAAYCLAPAAKPIGLSGEEYRRARAQAAWALQAIHQLVPMEHIELADWRAWAAAVDRGPAQFLAGIGAARKSDAPGQPANGEAYPGVLTWEVADAQKMTPVPPAHWLLVQDAVPFRAALRSNKSGEPAVEHVESIAVRDGHVACFAPREQAAEATLTIERLGGQPARTEGAIRFLPPAPVPGETPARLPCPEDVVLLTNGRGGMARLRIDVGLIQSKYDCVLGANLHPTLPVDRHILAKRLRLWVNADGFIGPLDFRSLISFHAGPPAVWNFVAEAGDGRTVEIQMTAAMLPGCNTTVFHFTRPSNEKASGRPLPGEADVRLTARLDIEDRNFHWETKRNGAAEHHFSSHVHPLPAATAAGKVGFAFSPAADRQLRAYATGGAYHRQPEWSDNIPHPVEQSRGQVGSGDAFSPGWFDLPLPSGTALTLVVTAEPVDPELAELATACAANVPANPANFGRQLTQAAQAFVVRRGEGKTVIAGYPWFLDWGRDTFICARGLLAAGRVEEVRQLAVTFARFEKAGTLPNTIFGEDASNRDTSDAPLWFALVCEELSARIGALNAVPTGAGRTLSNVLTSIAEGYLRGTPNGIRMDPASGLIWSPSHFTWMDTNYPAGTPREGYPVEIQALWIRLLRHLATIDEAGATPRWAKLADRALASVQQLFWREASGYYADVLLAKAGQGAAGAVADDALRSNCLLLVSLGLVEGERARRCVQAAQRHLVIPGALRTLAPLKVSVPLAIHTSDGRLLNDPHHPYWGHYEGDEDTRRKPAYHNGTAWTWTFPIFCEALARAWEFSPAAVAAAKAYLGSVSALLNSGCLGHLPEIVDGDIPHTQRGCDAQAWGATEALRVWRLLEKDGGR